MISYHFNDIKFVLSNVFDDNTWEEIRWNWNCNINNKGTFWIEADSRRIEKKPDQKSDKKRSAIE